MTGEVVARDLWRLVWPVWPVAVAWIVCFSKEVENQGMKKEEDKNETWSRK
jgi:hypothetical protein